MLSSQPRVPLDSTALDEKQVIKINQDLKYGLRNISQNNIPVLDGLNFTF
jgi:hypothetical protein